MRLPYEIRASKNDLFFPPATELPLSEIPDLAGTVAFVSGASAGIGKEVLKVLMEKNCHVVIGVRNKEKADKAVEEIRTQLATGGGPIGQVDTVLFDLSDLATLKAVPEQLARYTDHLDIVIHNAGLNVEPGIKSAQGFDGTYGPNVVGTFVLQRYLEPSFLRKSDSPYKRLVWVTSAAANVMTPKIDGGINWEQVESQTFATHDDAYAQSKVALTYLAYYWSVVHAADIRENDKIISLSCHPGMISTEVYRHLQGFRVWLLQKMSYPAARGAEPELYAAVSPALNSRDHQGVFVCPWGRIGELRPDVEAGLRNGVAQRVWDYVEKLSSGY